MPPCPFLRLTSSSSGLHALRPSTPGGSPIVYFLTLLSSRVGISCLGSATVPVLCGPEQCGSATSTNLTPRPLAPRGATAVHTLH